MERCGRLMLAPRPARRAFLGERAHALAHVLRGERRAAQLDQLPLDVVGSSSPSAASSAAITRLLPRCESGALPASSAASSSASASSSLGRATRLTSPHCERGRRVDVAAEQEQLARARRADRVDEAAQARVRVDEAELRRRHAELDPVLARRAGRRRAPAPARRRSCGPAASRASGRGSASSASIASVNGCATSRSARSSNSSSGISPMS